MIKSIKRLLGISPDAGSTPALPADMAQYSTRDLWRLQSKQKFQLTEEPGDSIFLVSATPMPGGMGHGVMDIPASRRIWHEGGPVFYCGHEIPQFVDAEMKKRPQRFTPEGLAVPQVLPENILVAVRAGLVKRRGLNSSIPGGALVTYWEARIDRIYSARALWRGDDL